jgi:transposase
MQDTELYRHVLGLGKAVD